ncbi:MAG TPA: response regulator transcription factor [Rubrivivax sp.]|nr:response regulator transcription factor [Rubrivivax sp.]
MSSPTVPPLPATLALVDDDAEYSEYLAQHLEALGVDVHHFADSNDLLTSDQPFGFGFYIVDLMLPGVDGVDLIGLLRRRTQAGILVVSGRAAPDVFARVIDIGADMYLTKPVSFEQVVVAVRGVHRRVSAPAPRAWVLDSRVSRLVAPDGALVSLSDTDLAVMQAFLEARGETVTRQALCRRLGHADTPEAENLLSATVYRLRRRVERATPLPVPLQTQARVGYIFRAELTQA